MRTIQVMAIVSLGALSAIAASDIPGDAGRGEEVFRTEGCVQCHSVNGKGGNIGPDLGQRIARNYTPALMASLMWNHAPAMWSAMEKKGIERPTLTSEQAADLFAFFYSARYFAQPGDAGRGKQVFESEHCANCHGLTKQVPAGMGAKPVTQWTSLNDPILLAQEMWNHSSPMKAAFTKRGIERPHLTSQELTDLLVYLRNLPQTRGGREEFTAASPETGKMLFQVKGCANCHKGKQSLENRFANRTMTDFAVAMWNHAFQMAEPAPELRAEEMRRIVGYLWSLQFFGQRGNPEKGRQVFEAQKCAVCHENPSTGAPRLEGRKLDFNSLSMISVLWDHGPAMLQQMKKRDIAWPRFTGSEMSDLIAYLNSKQ
jgi:mono/diheme cytochrome c family protein